MGNKNDPKIEVPTTHLSSVPLSVARKHAEKITEDAVENSSASTQNSDNNGQYSLNDDRRVQVLSPGALVAKRFFRNRLAVTGMIILLAMFIFSFVGGIVSPYKQDEKFYRIDQQVKEFAGFVHNEKLVYTVADASVFTGPAQAYAGMAISKGEETFEYDGTTFSLEKVSDDLYLISAGDNLVCSRRTGQCPSRWCGLCLFRRRW